MTDETTPATDPVPAERDDEAEYARQLAEEHAQQHPEVNDGTP